MSQVNTEEEKSAPAPSEYERQPVYVGDPEDKRMIRTLSRRGIIPYIFMALLFAGNVVQYLRNPETLIIRENAAGERVVIGSNREYLIAGDIKYVPDSPGTPEKIALVKIFTKNLYGIDPYARKYQLEQSHRLLMDDFAAQYFSDYKASGQLDRQRDEQWQAKWETQKVEVDRADPFLVHVIGTQEITKHIGQTTKREVVQHAIDFKLTADSPRSERNALTGYLISNFKASELSRTNLEAPGSEILLPQ